MGYGYGYGYYFDPTYILLIIGMLLSLAASAKLKSTFAYYRRVRSASGLTGEEAARRILMAAGITDVQVRAIPGSLTDHYDPRNKTVNLSQDIYGQTSLAAVGVAAHECGHAIQDNIAYQPLVTRRKLVPIANIGSTISYPVILLGIIFGATGLLNIGIILFSAVVVFQLVTLPVEFDASKRACAILEGSNRFSPTETEAVKKVLSAAAMTYLASALNSILQLMRLLNIARRR